MLLTILGLPLIYTFPIFYFSRPNNFYVNKSYSKEDEEARYNDLLVNFTCKYIIIRFNPDSYVNKKGVKTNPYISARLEQLKKELDKQLKRIENNENAELLEVVHLYYDGYK